MNLEEMVDSFECRFVVHIHSIERAMIKGIENYLVDLLNNDQISGKETSFVILTHQRSGMPTEGVEQ